MSGFDIGLTGLNAAQKGLDVIGNNVANAATEGYHRQTVDLTPAYSGQEGGALVGDGVEVKGITRLIDKLLEQEILRQQSSLGQVSQESTTLSSIESAFGELTGDTGLSAAINKFVNALSNLNAHPDEIAYQNEVLTSADAMAGQFRTLGDFLTNLKTQIKLQAENTVDQVNTLAGQIAELNDNVQRIEMSGGESGNLLDQRDELISQMSELTGVVTQQRDYGVVDVSVGGVPIVMGSATIQLEIGLNNEGQLGVTPAGAFTYQTTIDGGQLGGLLSLYNTTVDGIQSNLDTLASAIIQQVNQYHVGGVGSDGSFTELTGQTMLSENLSDFVPPVKDGSFFVRVTNTSTGEVNRYQINVDASSDTLTSIAHAIDDIDGLSASPAGSRLSIQADAGYEFDFLPAVLSSPKDSTFTGSLPPTVSVSGVYTGTDNPTLTFTVVGNGSVGNDTLQLEVRNGTKLVDTLNVGAGYVAGDYIKLDNGIKIALSTGDLNAGNSFTVNAFGNTDTSGFLAAAGMNTFFSGSNASNIAISDNVADSPGRIATALGSDSTDNANALRLASLGDLKISDLNSLTVSQFYSKLVTNIGQQLSVKQTSQSSVETLVQGLTTQQSNISGVDTNNEAAKMLVFEQMFQAMAKYIGTVQTTLSSLMELL